jgi:hypothetical protein
MTNILFFTTALFLININAGIAQDMKKQYAKDSLQIRKCPVDVIKLLDDSTTYTIGTSPILFPFSSVIIKDVRYDQNFIGVTHTNKALTAGFRKLRFKKGTEAELSQFFNDSTRFNFQTNDKPLLCFVKQLRLAQIDSAIKKEKAPKTYTTVRVELEAYLGAKDRFYPAVRLDTLAAVLNRSDTGAVCLRGILKAFAHKAAGIDTARVLTRTGYSLDEVREKYNKRVIKPIINDQILKNGVYKNKDEFFNNSPSIKEYEFSKEGFLYTRTEKNEWAATREAFGFCDGSRIWINAGKNFYPLIRQGDTFEFIADRRKLNSIRSTNQYHHVDVYRSPGMSMEEWTALYAATNGILLLVDLNNNYTNKFVYQIDLETGAIF